MIEFTEALHQWVGLTSGEISLPLAPHGSSTDKEEMDWAQFPGTVIRPVHLSSTPEHSCLVLACQASFGDRRFQACRLCLCGEILSYKEACLSHCVPCLSCSSRDGSEGQAKSKTVFRGNVTPSEIWAAAPERWLYSSLGTHQLLEPGALLTMELEQ